MTDFNDPNRTTTTTTTTVVAATSTTTTTGAAPAGKTYPDDDSGPDPLASLHKMSTTAGITSQEYVAINIPSIVAFVLGIASLVAVLNPVLLVLPLAAVVTAYAALSQIRD